MKNTFLALGVSILAVGVTACSSSPTPVAPTAVSSETMQSAGAPAPARGAKPGSSTITQLVVSNGDFDILEWAVIEAGLAGVLDGKGQYTVFAPSDDAFRTTLGVATEQEAIAALAANFTTEQLRNILLFHVTEGRRISTSVLAAPSYEMLNGGILTREKLSAAGILATDISASNGIVHVIGGVLLP